MTRLSPRYRPDIGQLVALALLLLTAAALFWPRESEKRGDGTLLVLDPTGELRRQEALGSLAVYLARESRLDLRLEVVSDHQALKAALPTAQVIFCPDGTALDLPMSAWQALATGRRRVPWNLRPTSVLLSRQGVDGGEEPWVSMPGRTAFGDSLSLVCLAPLCLAGGNWNLPAGVMWGQDPYDHQSVLAAAAMGAIDHLVVRQWDAEAALKTGLLSRDQWLVRQLSTPLPDVMVLASRNLPRAVRLDLQEGLTGLGRHESDQTSERLLAQERLREFGLEGFNLLVGPDFERFRRRYGPCWPRPTE